MEGTDRPVIGYLMPRFGIFIYLRISLAYIQFTFKYVMVMPLITLVIILILLKESRHLALSSNRTAEGEE